jgi:hypothetical protein
VEGNGGDSSGLKGFGLGAGSFFSWTNAEGCRIGPG